MKKETNTNTNTNTDIALLRALALQLRAALLRRMEAVEEMSAHGL